MSEKILNGDFSAGVDYWINAPEGQPFTVESGRIKSSSNSGDVLEVTHCIDQEFSSIYTVMSALISAWRRYEAPAGGVSNGQVISKVWLRKPDTTWVVLADETQAGATGEGQLLTALDILASMATQGNYILRLYSNVTSAKSNNIVSGSNPYSSWGLSNITLDDPNAYVESNSGDLYEQTGYVEKNFVVTAAAHTARITVWALGAVNLGHEIDGYARFVVKLKKVGGPEWTLYSGEPTPNSWQKILDNVDISGYVTSAGTYQIYIEGKTASSYDSAGPSIYINQSFIGTMSVSFESYSYEVSHGYFDDIFLALTAKRTKVVLEVLGAGERTGLTPAFSSLEILKIAESTSTRKFRMFTVSEALGIAETCIRKIKITVLEALKVAGKLIRFKKDSDESFKLAEDYSLKCTRRKTNLEGMGISERLTGILTIGNYRVYITIGTPTGWLAETRKSTTWRRDELIEGH